ncbi:hypothetical protein CXG81DRAFT_2452, partial [Caulochytrium protostelioides]
LDRTTKTAQKLTLFPQDAENLPNALFVPGDEESDSQLLGVQLPHVTAKTGNQYRLSKSERRWLPRVTAYSTAHGYQMEPLIKWLESVKSVHKTFPKRFDEVVFTPFLAPRPGAPRGSTGAHRNVDYSGHRLDPAMTWSELPGSIAPIGEVFFFDYGVVVMWGLPEDAERLILRQLERFSNELLDTETKEVEEFYFHYNPDQPPRIYNDVITLKNPSNYMVKLATSHAIAQSVKLTLYESLIDTTIERTKHMPQILAKTGKIKMSRKAINQKIGQLYITRTNVNLVSNVLDTPEIFWSEPALEPLYMAVRGYLEISQRVDLINQRLSVISDLLDMLKENLTSTHDEQLEWIIIILIVFEIIAALITISFDLSSY